MMKYAGVFVIIVCCVVAISVMAQSQETATSPDQSPELEISQEPSASAEATPTPEAADTVSKAPRRYPIAAGVWYPGQPVPKTASRYYRIRCWPGCHSYGEWKGPVDPDHAASSSY